jgi:hypothetical protein
VRGAVANRVGSVSVVLVVRTAVLKIPRKEARKRLNTLIDRGRRLADLAKGPWELRSEGDLPRFWNLWYNACLVALREIYPSDEPADLIHRAAERAKSWPMKVQVVVDFLENLRDTLHQDGEPPVGVTILQWVLKRPAAEKTLSLLTGAGAWEILRRLIEWVGR